MNRLKRSVWASGHLHALAEPGFRPAVAWFVTLTYVGVDDWDADHISSAIKRFRNWCRSRDVPCRYTWVAELQRRGAVHYHLLAWLPPGVSMPHWDRPTKTQRGLRPPFWSHGMTETDKARSGVGYLMKYLSKLGEFHRFPKGLRLYGIGGLDQQARDVRGWFNLPQWAKQTYGVGDLARIASRLVVRATGELLKSPFAVSFVPGGLLVRLVGTLPEPRGWGAYSTFPRVAY